MLLVKLAGNFAKYPDRVMGYSIHVISCNIPPNKIVREYSELMVFVMLGYPTYRKQSKIKYPIEHPDDQITHCTDANLDVGWCIYRLDTLNIQIVHRKQLEPPEITVLSFPNGEILVDQFQPVPENVFVILSSLLSEICPVICVNRCICSVKQLYLVK